MLRVFRSIYHSLISRLILLVGLTLFVSIFTWAYFNINYQKKSAIEGIVEEVDRLGNTIRLGTHYAMMLNSRDDINQIIKNVSRQEGIENVRIYNKLGQIKFSNVTNEVDTITTIKAEACDICHKTEPPLEEVDMASRTRIFDSGEGHRLIGIISPIYNEPSCATDVCHVHPEDKKVLGALDVVVSLQNTDKAILSHERTLILHGVVSFAGASVIIGIFLLLFVNRPIKGLIAWTRSIGEGNYEHHGDTHRADEIGQLALAIGQMGQDIKRKQQELNRQRNEYQELFELVPCYITVQDRNLRLVRYNREFTRHFGPTPGDYCYKVYKGRDEPCDPCPVMKTFCDGKVHTSEEAGFSKDGEICHWVVHSSPIRDADGKIVYVMETSLDTTKMKLLEEEIRRSEKKYRDIFNHIPNPVFVLDKKNLSILDCNEMATLIYGFSKGELLQNSFLSLFEDAEREHYAKRLMSSDDLTHTRQRTKDGRTIFVNMRISPSDYLGREALLVTTSDVTKRLMAEQQLIQASKMATLGEMATGIAHELNQPLSVIKTASSFVAKKVRKGELIREDILKTMAEEIDSHVDRASGIINHLREFGRKSEVKREKVMVNEALRKALDIFSQQLKLRNIEVETDFDEGLPPVHANSNRLEQVFINLLINARDAIEERVEKAGEVGVLRKISLKTRELDGKVVIQVRDTGTGIPRHILEKIFEPFFTTKTVGKGTGLGLSISYGIVQDYEGTIEVETVENEGSNFIVSLPVLSEVE